MGGSVTTGLTGREVVSSRWTQRWLVVLSGRAARVYTFGQRERAGAGGAAGRQHAHFEQIFARYHLPLLDYLYGMTRDREWAADMVLTTDGRYLFYGGYRSASEGGAFLHRVDLTAATDTKLVSLGMAGFGPYQGTPVCPWTGPWGVTADGTHVAYHNPGPSSTPSDTNNPKDTPIFYASVDGSSATKPFGNLLAQGITAPVFSPDGHYMAAYGSTYAPYPQQNDATTPQTALATLGGSYKIINGRFAAWRADSQAMVLETADGKYLLYSPASGTTRTLENGADVYLWGH